MTIAKRTVLIAIVTCLVATAADQAQERQPQSTLVDPKARENSESAAAEAVVTDLRPLTLELAVRFPENASRLREEGAKREKLIDFYSGILLEIVRRTGNVTTQYHAKVEISIYSTIDEAKKQLPVTLFRFPAPFEKVSAPKFGENCYEFFQAGQSKTVIFQRRNAIVYARYIAPETFTYNPNTRPSVTNLVLERDPLIGGKCDELAIFVDQFLIRAQ